MRRPAQPNPKPNPPFDNALWLWGRMRDFERDCFGSKDLVKLLNQMTPSMRSDVRRIAPDIARFFRALKDDQL